MKRYYVCNIIGSGSSTFDAHRPAIADIVDPATFLKAFNYTDVFAINADGSLKFPWCLVIASGANQTLATGDPDIDQMPDYSLDVKISAMDVPTKAAILAKLAARGIDTTSLSNSDSYRALIQLLGQIHVPTFSADSFDVADV